MVFGVCASWNFCSVIELRPGIAGKSTHLWKCVKSQGLAFKSQIVQDPLQIMSSWNDSLHFCNWAGVTCNPFNGRVMILNLEAQKLVSSIPPSIGNLSFLTRMNLQNNSFRGQIPQELGLLLHLKHLNLTSNSFGRMILTNLTHCSDLRVLQLNSDELTGLIPDHLSSLSKLLIFASSRKNPNLDW
ncbi:LRR receptor-like serine/threonine-protein kinase EFR [Camellia lanceoleosa]|uniref:LRR receptor-like serine/threonine-protein kinase EFR n=1 Tax=Camellia lanceoleosa TaxID=1840588 RepID=A0ACC0GF56_9ERIC|nr:LRR receptor-like serine/threonine-protein kinase EFR [Camellia lanceoleosa]